MEPLPLLEAESVGRQRPQSHTWLIRDVSLALHAGESLAVRGPSGSGKTLLLRALAMLDEIDEGEVRWRGRLVPPAEAPHYRAQVIYLHQQCVCWEGSVRDNLVRPWQFQQHRAGQYSEHKVVEQLQLVGRDASFLDKSAVNLSGGERQIMGVIRALQLEPTVMLLDEPTAALDEESTRQVEALVKTWRSPNRGCIWVSHSSDQTERVAEQVIELGQR